MTDTPSTPRVLGVDFSYARPSVAQIKALGAHWVGRYLSTDPGKGLSKAELDDYLAAVLDVVLFYETTATRALQGFTAGHNDGHTAAMLRASLGIPASVPIYFTADTDTSWSAVEPYFSGAEQAVGVNKAGVYGGYQVVQGAANAGFRYLCQTIAWSHGQWCSRALIRQEGQLMHGQADEDFGMAVDFGQYPNPTTQEDDFMALFNSVADFKAAVVAAVQSIPARDALATADLWWLEHALAGTVPAGASQDQAHLITTIHQLVQQLAQASPAVAAHTAVTAAAVVPAQGTAPDDAADTSAEPASADAQSV